MLGGEGRVACIEGIVAYTSLPPSPLVPKFCKLLYYLNIIPMRTFVNKYLLITFFAPF